MEENNATKTQEVIKNYTEYQGKKTTIKERGTRIKKTSDNDCQCIQIFEDKR